MTDPNVQEPHNAWTPPEVVWIGSDHNIYNDDCGLPSLTSWRGTRRKASTKTVSYTKTSSLEKEKRAAAREALQKILLYAKLDNEDDEQVHYYKRDELIPLIEIILSQYQEPEASNELI